MSYVAAPVILQDISALSLTSWTERVIVLHELDVQSVLIMIEFRSLCAFINHFMMPTKFFQ